MLIERVVVEENVLYNFKLLYGDKIIAKQGMVVFTENKEENQANRREYFDNFPHTFYLVNDVGILAIRKSDIVQIEEV